MTERKQLQEWIDDPTLPDCPFCGATADPLDELGRKRWDAVRISHSIKRAAWAEIMPPDAQYTETFAVCCGRCGGSGGARANVDAAREVWARRNTTKGTG